MLSYVFPIYLRLAGKPTPFMGGMKAKAETISEMQCI